MIRIARSRRTSSRKGAVAAQVAFFLAALMAVVALAMDGGTLVMKRRDLQAAADAAAMAGATDMYKHWFANHGDDPSDTALASALTYASDNGFNNDGVTNTVVVRRYGETFLGGPR